MTGLSPVIGAGKAQQIVIWVLLVFSHGSYGTHAHTTNQAVPSSVGLDSTENFWTIRTRFLADTVQSVCPNPQIQPTLSPLYSHSERAFRDVQVNSPVPVEAELYLKSWRRISLRFYQPITRLESPTVYVLLKAFKDYLSIPDHMGVHKITLQANNQSVEELEDAIAYAWQSSFENVGWTHSQASVEIVDLYNCTGSFSATGSRLMVIVYIVALPVEGEDGFYERLFTGIPKYNPVQLPRLIPPSVQVLRQRLHNRSLTLHDGDSYRGSAGTFLLLRTNHTGSLRDEDLEQTKEEIKGAVVGQRVRIGCGKAGTDGDDDLHVHFGNIVPAVVSSRRNGTYADITLAYLTFALMVKNKLYVGLLKGLAEESPRFYDPWHESSSHNSQPRDATCSFQLHLDRPISVQQLPELERSMNQRLNATLKGDQRLEVIGWAPDLDGFTVNFFVVLHHRYGNPVVLDSRLRYAKAIYSKLNGTIINVNRTALNPAKQHILPAFATLTDHPLTQKAKADMKADILQICLDTPLWVLKEDCPVTNFTLYLENFKAMYDDDQPLLNSTKVLLAVEQAFSLANPVMVDGRQLRVTLTGRDDNLLTVTGDNAIKFTFATGDAAIDNSKDWKLWSYPTVTSLEHLLNATASARLVKSRVF